MIRCSYSCWHNWYGRVWGTMVEVMLFQCLQGLGGEGWL